jgi:hypothetical protein
MNLYTFQYEYQYDIKNIYNNILNDFTLNNIMLFNKEELYKNLVIFLFNNNKYLKKL